MKKQNKKRKTLMNTIMKKTSGNVIMKMKKAKTLTPEFIQFRNMFKKYQDF